MGESAIRPPPYAFGEGWGTRNPSRDRFENPSRDRKGVEARMWVALRNTILIRSRLG